MMTAPPSSVVEVRSSSSGVAFLKRLLRVGIVLAILIVPNFFIQVLLPPAPYTTRKDGAERKPGSAAVVQQQQSNKINATADPLLVLRTTGAEERQKHWPTNFSNAYNLSNNLKRGNFHTTIGGCKFSRWVYNQPISFGMEMVYAIQNASITEERTKLKDLGGPIDCIYQPLQKWLNNASLQLKPYDTIYVPLSSVEHFVNVTLPQVRVPIVVISNQFSHSPNVDPFAGVLLSNEHVVRWFLTNIGMTVPNYTHHDKVSVVLLLANSIGWMTMAAFSLLLRALVTALLYSLVSFCSSLF